jgi:hypothetical protein
MSRGLDLVLRHTLDSVLVAGLGGSAAALLVHVFYPSGGKGTGSVFGAYPAGTALLTAVVFVLMFVLAAGVAPRHFLSALGGLRRIPTHWGLVVRCWAGGCLAIGVLWLLGFHGIQKGDGCPIWPYVVAYTILLAVGLLFGGMVAWFLHARPLPPVRQSDTSANRRACSATDICAWLTDDRPINDASECLVPAHLDTARRILDRLATRSTEDDTPGGNVALIGSYGSGKTSICNLVQSEYEGLRRDRPKWPHFLFCRFEAWRYISAEAALGGLVETVAERALEAADESALWSLGEQYVLAAKETGLGWAGAAALLLGGGREPSTVLMRLGSLLARIDRHIVVFVDDLDRIEATSADQQQALVQALNQLQGTPNVQYVLTVGPAHWGASREASRRPLLDLLKLTRFQELVPELQPEVALQLLRPLRDLAKDEPELVMPWAEVVHETDPLEIPSWRKRFGIPAEGLAAILVELLRTPRELKSVLRETHVPWEGGLRGEINWYNLLLANAVKVAEPAVFEWMLRDKDLFLREQVAFGPQPADAGQQQAEAFQHQLRAILAADTDNRNGAVTRALTQLFPVFGQKISPQGRTGVEPRRWMQDIAATPANGQSYLHRFAAGRVPEGDLPDLPVLRHIKTVHMEGFSPEMFEEKYLMSYEKLTGAINKVEQFARFLGAGNVLAACSTILDWASRPESIKVWPEPRGFYMSVSGDVYHMLDGSEIADLLAWLREEVKKTGRRCPLLAGCLIHMFEPGQSGLRRLLIEREQATVMRQLLAETATEEFVTGDRKLISIVVSYPFALAHFVGILRHHPQYDKLRSLLTRKLVDEAEQTKSSDLQREMLTALPSIVELPVMSGPVPPEAYKFSYDQALNKEQFDMSILLPVVKKWHSEGVADPLAQRVLRELAAEYRF